MIKILSAITLDNPNDTKKPTIKVKIDQTSQIVEAFFIAPITMDTREQLPNIQNGTEIMILADDDGLYVAIGSSSIKDGKQELKNYLIENDNEVKLKSEKLINLETQEKITMTGKQLIQTIKDIVETQTKQIIQEATQSILSKAPLVELGDTGGKGVVTGECICHFTGNPHQDISSVVKAVK